MYPDIEQKHGITFSQANNLLRDLLARHHEGLSILAAWGIATERASELEHELEGVTKSFQQVNRAHTELMQKLGAEKMRREILEHDHAKAVSLLRSLVRSDGRAEFILAHKEAEVFLRSA